MKDGKNKVNKWYPVDSNALLKKVPLDTYEDKLEFLRICMSNNLKNACYFANCELRGDIMPAIKFYWKESATNKDKVELRINCLLKSNSWQKYVDEKITLNNLFKKDIRDISSQLCILYENNGMSGGLICFKEIKDCLIKLCKPKKCVTYPGNKCSPYRIIVRDKFVHLQELTKYGQCSYKDVEDLTLLFESIKIPSNSDELKLFIQQNGEKILSSCVHIDEKRKRKLCDELGLPYIKKNNCCFGLFNSCCSIC